MRWATWMQIGLVLAAEPQQAPFSTQLPWTLDTGEWEMAAGASWREDARPPFFTGDSALQRDEWHATLDVSYGVGPGSEVRLRAGLQGFEQEDGSSSWGVQDMRLGFTHQIPLAKLPVALSFGLKLPNAPDDDLLGTDETDVFLLASTGWLEERWGVAGHAGLGILGNPLENGSQDDVLLIGLAGWLSLRPSALLTLEAEGQAASRFGNDVRRATAGVTLPRARYPVSFTAGRGLTKVSEDWGVAVEVTLAHPSL